MSVKLGERSAPVATDSRAAIVAALGAIAGLVASPNVPDVPTEGATWPVWVQTTPQGSLAWPMRATYDVYTLLPAGYVTTTVETADGLLGQLLTALWHLCVCELAEPVSVRFENQTTMPGIRLRVTMRGSNDA